MLIYNYRKHGENICIVKMNISTKFYSVIVRIFRLNNDKNYEIFSYMLSECSRFYKIYHIFRQSAT